MGNSATRAKAKYNKENYSEIKLSVPKELKEKFKEKCFLNKVSQAKILKKAIEDYINN